MYYYEQIVTYNKMGMNPISHGDGTRVYLNIEI